jgi:hypothetical protein
MRRLLLSGTAVLALTAGFASAGGMAEPVMPPAEIEAETAASSGGVLIPILLLLLVAAALSSGGSSGGTAPVFEASDRRLKTDVEWVGMQQGVAVYQWRYLDRPGRYQGVMAQEVLASHPRAVVPRHDGMLTVDYSRLPVAFRRLH